jgi:nucleoside-diphosphate-sugar epimerase
MIRRVLVTGHDGYIGAVMAGILASAGYDVTGLDTFYFGPECTFVPDQKKIPFIKKDLRDVTVQDLNGFDAVVHLAALCNDPLGNMDASWTYDINHKASIKLAKAAKEAGVQRFLFSSSCSMHGASSEAKVTEESPVSPLTPYGDSKIKAENEIRQMADEKFSPTFLRNGTVYGVSPRMRLDIVLNNLTAWAFTTGKVRIMSDGSPWRPVVHVDDVSQAFQTVLEAPRDVIHNQVFHVGHNTQNFRIRDLAEIVQKVSPGCQIEYVSEASADNRTYIADFSKIERLLPKFKPQWTPEKGAKQLIQAYKEYGLTVDDLKGNKFIRLNRISQLLKDKKLNNSLRWS